MKRERVQKVGRKINSVGIIPPIIVIWGVRGERERVREVEKGRGRGGGERAREERGEREQGWVRWRKGEGGEGRERARVRERKGERGGERAREGRGEINSVGMMPSSVVIWGMRKINKSPYRNVLRSVTLSNFRIHEAAATMHIGLTLLPPGSFIMRFLNLLYIIKSGINAI